MHRVWQFFKGAKSPRTTRRSRLEFRGLVIELSQKAMRTIRLRVLADGSIRLSAPFDVSHESLNAFLEARHQWIVAARSKALDKRPPPWNCAHGDTLSLWGQSWCVALVPYSGKAFVEPDTGNTLCIYCAAGASAEQRKALLDKWLRAVLAQACEQMLAQWQPRMGLYAQHWHIRRMKTRWGSCTPLRGKLCFNLDLVRYPKACLEYVVVHELAHLQERGHTAAFWLLVGSHLPSWQACKHMLARRMP